MVRTFTVDADAEGELFGVRFGTSVVKNYKDIDNIIEDVYIEETLSGLSVMINVSTRWPRVHEYTSMNSKDGRYYATIYLTLHDTEMGWRDGAKRCLHGVTFDMPDKFKDICFDFIRHEQVEKEQVFITYIDPTLTEEVEQIERFVNPKITIKRTLERLFGA